MRLFVVQRIGFEQHKVKVGPPHEQAGKAPLADHFDRGAVLEGSVAVSHPAVSQVEVVRKQRPLVFVKRELVPHAHELVAAGADRLPTAVPREICAVAAGRTEQSSLVLGALLPVVEQLHDSVCAALPERSELGKTSQSRRARLGSSPLL